MNPSNNENIALLLSNVADTIRDKNHDYNNAFAESFAEIGPMYAVGKIFEKYKRINALSKSENAVKGEGLRDALLDCIGYCALYIDQLDQEACAAQEPCAAQEALCPVPEEPNDCVATFGNFRLLEEDDRYIIIKGSGQKSEIFGMYDKDNTADMIEFHVGSTDEQNSIIQCMEFIFDKTKPYFRPIIRFV